MARTKGKKSFVTRIAIVGDGFTEKIYFEQLRAIEALKDIVIRPELPSKSSKGGGYKKALNTALSLAADGYDHVYCLIDYDTVLSERNEANFRESLAKINPDEVTVYINNPCFEMWVLLHYERTGRAFSNCNDVERAINRYLPGYCKSQEYLRSVNLYKTLRPMLENPAIPNAELLERDRDARSSTYPRAEVFKFLQRYVVGKG